MHAKQDRREGKGTISSSIVYYIMVRGKTNMSLIENSTGRQVTFSKRKNGVLKKARELAKLCATEVVAIVYSERGKLSQYSSKRYVIIFRVLVRIYILVGVKTEQIMVILQQEKVCTNIDP